MSARAPGPVAATLTAGANNGGAIELAVRSARARHVPVRVVDGSAHGRRATRYLNGITRDVRKAGVDVSADGAAEPPGLAIRPLPDPGTAAALADVGPGLVVRAKPTLGGDDATERLKKLGAPTP